MGTTITARRPSETEAEQATNDVFTSSSYRASLGQLTGYFRAKGVPRDEAADLANETIVRVLVHLKRHGRDRTDLGPLARTIARNLLVERVRKAAPVLVPLGDDLNVADDALEPADQVLASERQDAVRGAIRSLSPRHRHVVGMWMEGRTPAEIARSLGIKRNAVDAILHRARRSLASKLDGGGVLGLVAIAGLRIRLFGRRVAEMVSSVDPTGQVTPSGFAAAAVGLAAVLTLTGPSGTAINERPGVNARTAHTSVQPVEREAARAEAAAAGVSKSRAPAPIARDTRETYEMTIGTQLAGEQREEDPKLAEVTYDPEANGRSDLDPLLEVVFETCVSARSCAAEDDQ